MHTVNRAWVRPPLAADVASRIPCYGIYNRHAGLVTGVPLVNDVAFTVKQCSLHQHPRALRVSRYNVARERFKAFPGQSMFPATSLTSKSNRGVDPTVIVDS